MPHKFCNLGWCGFCQFLCLVVAGFWDAKRQNLSHAKKVCRHSWPLGHLSVCGNRKPHTESDSISTSGQGWLRQPPSGYQSKLSFDRLTGCWQIDRILTDWQILTATTKLELHPGPTTPAVQSLRFLAPLPLPTGWSRSSFSGRHSRTATAKRTQSDDSISFACFFPALLPFGWQSAGAFLVPSSHANNNNNNSNNRSSGWRLLSFEEIQEHCLTVARRLCCCCCCIAVTDLPGDRFWKTMACWLLWASIIVRIRVWFAREVRVEVMSSSGGDRFQERECSSRDNSQGVFARLTADCCLEGELKEFNCFSFARVCCHCEVRVESRESRILIGGPATSSRNWQSRASDWKRGLMSHSKV